MTAVAATAPHPTRDDLDALGITCTVPQAARILGISEPYAYKLIAAGDFPVRVLEIGSRISIPTADLKAYLLGETAAQPDVLDRLDALLASHAEAIRLLSIIAAATIRTPLLTKEAS